MRNVLTLSLRIGWPDYAFNPTWDSSFSYVLLATRLNGDKKPFWSVRIVNIIFDLLGSLIKSGPIKGARAGIITGDKTVSGLSGFWVLAMKPGRNLKVALCLSCPNTTSAGKAQTSLLGLAEANVRRKAVCASDQQVNRRSSAQRDVSWENAGLGQKPLREFP